jgi:CHAT domain-containing protein
LNVTIAFSQLAIHLIHFASFMDHQPANPAEPIDEDRLRAYVALIDKLLLGARENANALLNAQRELVDEGLVEVMGRYAESLRQTGNQEAAAFLEGCGKQITAFLRQPAADGRTSSPSGEQETFMKRLLQRIAESQADPQVLYPLLHANLHHLNMGLVEKLASLWEGVLTSAESDVQQALAKVLVDFGSLLQEFPHGSPGTNTRIAIAACENALRVNKEQELPQAWATTNNILGNAYFKLAPFSANPGEQIVKAIAAFCNALKVFTEEALPKDFARINNNLGTAYGALADLSANPDEQILEAIGAFNKALRVFTEEERPQDWAATNNNLGNAYRVLAPFSSNPGEQIKEAIAAFNNALQVFTEAEQRENWALTKNDLGNAYRELAPYSANPGEQIKKAIAAYNNALLVRIEAELPQDWAATNNNLGSAYLDLAPFSANPREQIENAIDAYRNALRVYTETELPQDYAMTNNNLGNAYLNLAPFSANPLEQIKTAIDAYYRNALRVYTETEFPQYFAVTNNNLGNAYRDLAPFSANPREQINNAIDAYRNALRVRSEAELPQGYAMTNNNLSIAYRDLAPFSANPREQIENAIDASHNALRVYTETEFPQYYAVTNTNLGNAYLNLAPFADNPREQIENAINAYRNALRLRTEAELPQAWADTNDNLGNAYSKLAPYSANPGEQIKKAIAAYNNALLVRIEAELPQDWAATNNNLGNAHSELALFSANPREQIKNAIDAYRNALRVYTEAELPQDYAMTNNNLGNAYRELAPFSDNPRKQIENAIVAYRNALRLRDAVNRSGDCYQTARNFGNLGFANNLQDVAIEGYCLAITAAESLRSDAIEPARKAGIVSEAIEVYANLVRVYVDTKQYDKALEVVDRSKARNLVELLTTKDLYPKGEIPPEVISRLDELRGSIARAERELNWADHNSGSGGTLMDGSDGSGSPAGVRSLAAARFQQATIQDVGERLGQLKQELDRLIQEEIQPIDPIFSLSQKVQPLSIEQLRATLPDDRTVLVSWYVAGSKLLAFILTRDARQPLCHRYPESTLELLTAELNSYFGTYQSDKNAWMAELPAALARFSSLLELEALAEQISQFAPEADQLILVPHRYLHLLPLHCLPFGEASGSLQDQFGRGVRFAPSLQVLQVVQQRQQTPLESLFALQNPTQDLLYSELEVEAIQSLFTAKKPAVLKRNEASKRALEEQAGSLASSTCLHFACHGYFNFAQPQLSALILAGSCINLAPEDSDANRHWPQPDGTALDLNQCLTLLDLFQLDLRQARLVALSACETGLSGPNSLSDEFVGLSSGFLYAGCNSVIGTLWTVNDLSTGLLMGQFYRLLKQQEQAQQRTEVPLALKQAQSWLRQLTCAEAVATLQQQVPNLPEGIQETAKRSIRRALSERYAAEDRPYTNPFYWAAFCAVGQ